MFTLLIVVIVIALLFDLVNGFHDAANSIATVVATKVLSPFQAVLWAATFNVIAFWVFDMSVGNTVAKTVDNNAIDLWVILAGLISATIWNLFTWKLGIPSSSSHTLIGGFAGAAVAHAGFGVIESGEILKVIAFIFLAPLIGGVIAFGIALVTMSRKIFLKFFIIVGGSLLIYYLMNYMVEFMDMKPIMMYIVLVMLLIFILAFIYYMVVHGRRQTAMKESNMYKRLQLLSSAAFSLGHGGADSQKVMGIICAALMVYGNYARNPAHSEKVNENFQISEVLQIEHTNDEGKKDKYKPVFATVNEIPVYKLKDNVVDANTQEVIFKEDKLNSSYKNAELFRDFSFEEVKKDKFALINGATKDEYKLENLLLYTKGHDIYDSKTNELIFKDHELNKNYSFAGAFENSIEKETGELIKGYKIRTKVNSSTMPFWIAFGCYLMIGIGTLFGGWKIVKTMGSKITKVTPLEGVCAETAGALTLFVVSNLGIPVSTTHTITGAIIGVGATKRLSAVRWGVTIGLLWAWVLTIPVSGLLAAGIYYAICLFK
jgi:PiT family inorganic phosphate transporter